MTLINFRSARMSALAALVLVSGAFAAGCSSDLSDGEQTSSTTATQQESIPETVEGTIAADAASSTTEESPTTAPGEATTTVAEDTPAAPVPAAELGDEVASRYRNELNIDVEVTCPEDLKPEVGATVTCDAVLAGTSYTLEVKATSITDGVVAFEAVASQ